MKVGFKSDKGKKRKNNEDACFVMLKEKIYIIADGVGGGNSGEVASRIATTEVANYILKNPLPEEKTDLSIRMYLKDCVEWVNNLVIEKGITINQNRGMCTTLVIAYEDDGRLFIANAGDSRAYMFRDNRLRQITEDHTYVNSLIKQGLLTSEEAEHHPDKNKITKAVGAAYGIDADIFKEEIRKDDIFLLCTDGLYGELDEEEIKEVLSEDITMSDMANKLIDMANENGGHDNITVICLKVMEDDLNE